MRRKYSVPALILACVISAGSLSGCYFFPEEEKLLEPPVLKVEDVTYSTYKAVKKTIVDKAASSGYCMSSVQENCMFTGKDGILKKIYVQAGDVVKQGDLIAEYDTGDLYYAMREQELKLQQAKNTYAATGSENDRLQVEIEQNKLDRYQNEYDNSKIYAPVDGTVSFTERINPGDEVKAYEVIATIIDPTKIFVKASVNEERKFTKGQDVTITIGETDYEGVITYTPLDAKAEGNEDTTSVFAEFKGDVPSYAEVGKVADLTYIRDKADDAIVIPKYIVNTLDGKTFVQIYHDGEKIDVEVEIGITNATEVQILSGVNEGDEVVVK